MDDLKKLIQVIGDEENDFEALIKCECHQMRIELMEKIGEFENSAEEAQELEDLLNEESLQEPFALTSAINRAVQDPQYNMKELLSCLWDNYLSHYSESDLLIPATLKLNIV